MLGSELRARREGAGLSFRDAARAVGTSVSHLQRLEAGRTMPLPGTLRRLAEAYGADYARLMRLAGYL